MTNTETTTDIMALIASGQAALDSGDTIAARNFFRRVTELDQHNIDAWMGLAEASPRYAERRDYYRRVLTSDPNHQAAQAALAETERQLASGSILVPRTLRAAEQPVAPPANTPPSQAATVGVEHCYIHSNREAYVHCFQCNRPICSQCVNPSPVGQLCPECRKARRSANYKVTTRDLAIAFPVAYGVSAVLGVVVALFVGGFFLFFLLFIGPAIAELIVRAVERTTHMKRGREMQLTVSAAIVMGGLTAFLVAPNLLALLLYTGLAVSTAIARLR